MEPQTAMQVSSFIEDQYEKNKDNIGLLFAYAWVSIKFGDEVRGKQKMREFLALANNTKKNSILIAEALRMSK